MTKLQLVEIYATSWQKRDVSILAPYLDDTFSYTSVWVLANLDREHYLEYLKGKFEAIAESESMVSVSIGSNTIGMPAVVLKQDDSPQVYITIEESGGKIVNACMSPF